MERSEKSKFSTEFLIHEFNALQSRALNLESIKSSRINFFLIIVVAVTAGVSTVYKEISELRSFLMIGVLVLFVLGVTTLKHSVDYSAAIVILYRRAGRIRKWFVNENPEIEKYVAFEPNDDRPLFDISILAWRGGEAVILIINAMLLSIASTFAFYRFQTQLTYNVILAIVVFVVVWFGQNIFIYRRLRKADRIEQKNIYFPFRDSSNPKRKLNFYDSVLARIKNVLFG